MKPLGSAPTGRLARRLGAYVTDCLILFAGILVSQGLILAVGLNPLATHPDGTEPGASLQAWVFVTVTIPCVLYFAAFHAGSRGATPGKRWLGLRVVGTAGGQPGIVRALARSAITLLPFEWNHLVVALFVADSSAPLAWAGLALTYAAVFAYLACVLLDPQGRSPADRLASTRVIVL